MKKIRVPIALLTILFGLGGCHNQENVSNNKEIIKIGAILPLTGDVASYGKFAQSGIDLAIQEINDSGGINGRKLDIEYQDDKGESSEAVSIINKMISSDKIQIIIGSAASSVTHSICPIAAENKIVLFSPISSSKDLRTDCGDYFFRDCPSDVLQSRVLADWIWTKNLKTVGIIYVNNSWGNGLKDEFVDCYNRLGGKVAFTEATSEGQTDFRTLLTKIAHQKIDAIFAPTYGKDGGLLLKQYKQLGLSIPIFGGDVWGSPELMQSSGDAANDAYLIVPAKFTGNAYENFAKKYYAKYNQLPDVYASYSYDLTKIIFNALKAGNFSGEQIRNYLSNMPTYNGVTGETKFDKNGDVIGKKFSKEHIINMKYVEVDSI